MSMLDEVTEQELEAIEARVRATTPGPWSSIIEGRDQDSGESFIMTDGEDIYVRGGSEADQEFIAHARQDIPRLIAEIRRLRAIRS
jgi:hypothetical protein